jgi:hypothetical protein
MRVKKSFGLLLVLLVVPLAFAGIARSTAAASLTISPASGGLYASGNGWTPNVLVTFYFDTEDVAHVVTTVKASSAGSFGLLYLAIGNNVAYGPHTVIARQGANLATATYNPSSVNPPDDRLLNPILAINTEVGKIEAKLDSGGSFFEFVNQWFNHLDAKVSDVGDKVDAVEDKLDDAAVILGYYQGHQLLVSSGTVIRIAADKPVLFVVSLRADNLDGADYAYVWKDREAGSYAFVVYLTSADAPYPHESVTFAGRAMEIGAGVASGTVDIWDYNVMVMGMPGTVLTVTP